ncbi:YlxR family protein [Jonesia quinghaiensis]|uniref:YlxR family protein n=1 Tax=Jonesia quinghaiensis TaxID=262806 RepID=UPI0006878A5B
MADNAPERTCIGCRQRDAQDHLLRLVLRQRTTTHRLMQRSLVPDASRRLPGRGAWIHPEIDCVTVTQRKRAWLRAFKISGDVDASTLDELMASIRSPSNTTLRYRNPHASVSATEADTSTGSG